MLAGYEPLNAIHRSQMLIPTVGRSRYEVEQVLAPASDVVLAHVRRRELEPTATGFDEMALYVLVRRHGRWWLAAGHNTPVRSKP